MKNARPQADLRAVRLPAGENRSELKCAVRPLFFLILALCLSAAAQTADPYGDLLDRKFGEPPQASRSAGRDPKKMTEADWRVHDLEREIKLDAQKKAQARRVVPPPPSQTSLVLSAALPLAALLAIGTLGAYVIKQRFDAMMAARAAAGDNWLNLVAEDPSLEAFFLDLRDGLEATTTLTVEVTGALNGAQASDSDTALGPLQQFFDAAPRRLAGLRTLFSELGRANDDAARQRICLEFSEQVHSLKESSRVPALHLVWLMASALEGLVKQLSSDASTFTASAQRTAAGAVDLLESLCVQGLNPNLANEPPVRILAVDDDQVSRLAMSFALKRVFNDPHLAPDGATALGLAARQTYDVIFLDVEMPGMDGFELCTKIHETVRNRTTPVVFVTRHSDFHSRARSALSGGQDLIAKPYLAFEITVKALTLALRGRLKHGTPQPCSGSKAASDGTASATAAMATEVSAAIPSAAPAPTATPAAAQSPVSSDTPTYDTASWQLSDRAFQTMFSRNDSPDTFFTRAPVYFEELRNHLQAAQHEVEHAKLKKLLRRLRVGVQSLNAEAERAELRAASRLGSALDGLLKKMATHNHLFTPSTFSAASAALELLEELCDHAGPLPDSANPRIRILVVDDDPVARRAISMSVQLAFGRPDTAESGEAALALAAEKSYDLIFLDVLMPGIDGFSTCKQIHETELNARTPVMFVTGQDDGNARSRAVDAGGCGFIPKPALSSQITLTALTFILRARLEKSGPPSATERAARLEVS